MNVESDIEALLSAAHTLRLRLAGRSRSETFTPGSIAPELLRRAEELLSELPAALAKLQAERDEARAALRPTDYNTLGQIGKAALDVCLPILKAHWAGGGSASMNPSLEYLDVSMGKAAMEAASRALGGGE